MVKTKKKIDPDFHKFSKSLGSEIRRIREERGWTLESVDERGNIGWRHLQKIETGKNLNITLETLFSICKTLKISPSDLLAKIKF